jgi:hypothetical protein
MFPETLVSVTYTSLQVDKTQKIILIAVKTQMFHSNFGSCPREFCVVRKFSIDADITDLHVASDLV